MCINTNPCADEDLNDHVFQDEKVDNKKVNRRDALLHISGPGPKDLFVVISVPSKYWDKRLPVKGMFNGSEAKEGFNALVEVHGTMIGKVKIIESDSDQWEIACLER